jgi:hypothetical protein
MSQIVELERCPKCRCSKVVGESCKMCPLIEENTIAGPTCSGCNSRHEPSECPYR